MTRYIDRDEWEEDVVIPNTTTPILGGQPVWEGERLVDGFANVPIAILANRTRHLKNKIGQIEADIDEDFSSFVRKEDNLSDLEDLQQAKYNLGLNLVDNTRDADKEVSTPQQEALNLKVDKEAGKGLSTNDYTTAEKNKLASLESSKFKGEFVSLVALETALPTAGVGDYAFVDQGVGQDVVKYIWDNTDDRWVLQQGESAALTPADVKTLYESNANTNSFTDLEKTKLSGIEDGATNLVIGTSGTTAKAGDWQPTTATKSQVLSGTSDVFVSGTSYHNTISWDDLGSASSGFVTIDLHTSLNFTLSVSGNVTIENPTNSVGGKCGEIVITMSGDGVVSWENNWDFLNTIPEIGDSGDIWVISYKVLNSTSVIATANKVAT